MTQTRPSPLKCIAFDIGGVIAADVWENLFMTPQIGLADRYRINRDWTFKTGVKLWRQYAYSSSKEEDYWSSWDKEVGFVLDRAIIKEVFNKMIWADKTALPLIEDLLHKKLDVALVSNSTTFWFAWQMKETGIDKILPKLKTFLSHEIGHNKIHENGGLALLSKNVEPESILLVDDRIENINVAGDMGMKTLHYKRDPNRSLQSVVQAFAAKL